MVSDVNNSYSTKDTQASNKPPGRVLGPMSLFGAATLLLRWWLTPTGVAVIGRQAAAARLGRGCRI